MNGRALKPLSCLIVDDEPAAHQVLEFHIDNTPWLIHTGSFYNAVDALTYLSENSPDIVFLDVNMPNLTGFQLLDILQIGTIHFILTTAHSEHALHGYLYDVSAFLLKPVTFDQFLKAVNKIRLSVQKTSAGKNLDSALQGNLATPTINVDKDPLFTRKRHEDVFPHYDHDSIWIKVSKQTHRISFEEICFIESEKNYVKMHIRDSFLITRTSLNDLENNLPPGRFIRTHKSYIINRDAVKQIEGNTITMNNNLRVSISKPDRHFILNRLRKS